METQGKNKPEELMETQGKKEEPEELMETQGKKET